MLLQYYHNLLFLLLLLFFIMCPSVWTSPLTSPCKPLIPTEADTLRHKWSPFFVTVHYWWDKMHLKSPLGWWAHRWGHYCVCTARAPTNPTNPSTFCSCTTSTCIFKEASIKHSTEKQWVCKVLKKEQKETPTQQLLVVGTSTVNIRHQFYNFKAKS